MTKKNWLLQIPITILFVFAFWVTEAGIQGELHNKWLRDRFFPHFRRFSGVFTDWKFNFRGPRPPKSKVVIIEIDSPSIERLGRWPWHRDVTAFLIDKAFHAG